MTLLSFETIIQEILNTGTLTEAPAGRFNFNRINNNLEVVANLANKMHSLYFTHDDFNASSNQISEDDAEVKTIYSTISIREKMISNKVDSYQTQIDKLENILMQFAYQLKKKLNTDCEFAVIKSSLNYTYKPLDIVGQQELGWQLELNFSTEENITESW